MTFSNNPEKLSLFGGGCNGSATFSELFRLVWRTKTSTSNFKPKIQNQGTSSGPVMMRFAVGDEGISEHSITSISFMADRSARDRAPTGRDCAWGQNLGFRRSFLWERCCWYRHFSLSEVRLRDAPSERWRLYERLATGTKLLLTVHAVARVLPRPLEKSEL